MGHRFGGGGDALGPLLQELVSQKNLYQARRLGCFGQLRKRGRLLFQGGIAAVGGRLLHHLHRLDRRRVERTRLL